MLSPKEEKLDKKGIKIVFSGDPKDSLIQGTIADLEDVLLTNNCALQIEKLETKQLTLKVITL